MRSRIKLQDITRDLQHAKACGFATFSATIEGQESSLELLQKQKFAQRETGNAAADHLIRRRGGAMGSGIYFWMMRISPAQPAIPCTSLAVQWYQKFLEN